MAKFSNLSAPVTNTQAAKRAADTQALRARQLVASQPASAPIAPVAAQAGAQLTAAEGQANLQQQQQTAQQASQQAGQQLASQKQQSQQRIFDATQNQTQEERRLSESLFNLNQDAADKEQRMRNAFANGQAETKFLQEQELADWTVLNSENEEQFRDRIQQIEQAHAKQAAVADQAYKVVMQNLRQVAKEASQEDRQKLTLELEQIAAEWEAEKTRRQNKANNRQAMWSGGMSIVGAVGGGVVGLVAGGPAGAVLGASTGAQLGSSSGKLIAANTDI